MKAANPDMELEGLKEQLRRQWAVVDEATKAKYGAKADKDKISAFLW